MRVLVIGGTGHIGSYLVPRLVMGGHEVYVVARRPRPQYADARLCWGAVKWVVADRRAEEQSGAWAERMAQMEVDVVMDLLCYTPQQNQLMYEAFRGRVEHFIHCGTVWAYGPAERVPYEESYPRRPITDYGRNKAEIEAFLLAKYRQEGFPATAYLRAQVAAHRPAGLAGRRGGLQEARHWTGGLSA